MLCCARHSNDTWYWICILIWYFAQLCAKCEAKPLRAGIDLAKFDSTPLFRARYTWCTGSGQVEQLRNKTLQREDSIRRDNESIVAFCTCSSAVRRRTQRGTSSRTRTTSSRSLRGRARSSARCEDSSTSCSHRSRSTSARWRTRPALWRDSSPVSRAQRAYDRRTPLWSYREWFSRNDRAAVISLCYVCVLLSQFETEMLYRCDEFREHLVRGAPDAGGGDEHAGREEQHGGGRGGGGEVPRRPARRRTLLHQTGPTDVSRIESVI